MSLKGSSSNEFKTTVSNHRDSQATASQPTNAKARVDQTTQVVEKLGEDDGIPTYIDLKALHHGWDEGRADQHPELKQLLSHYAAYHFARWHGMELQLATGTQARFLLERILRMQVVLNKDHCLRIFTTSLRILSIGLSMKAKFPNLLGYLQIYLTGGSYHAPTHSLVGRIAARQVAEAAKKPDAVFFGATGLNFHSNCVEFRYQFPEQLATQESYATRRTKHRVFIFDHTKLGVEIGDPLELDMKHIAEKADKVTFVSSWPEKKYDSDIDVEEERRQIREHDKRFRFLVKKLKSVSPDAQRKVRLVFVDSKGGLVYFDAKGHEVQERPSVEWLNYYTKTRLDEEKRAK